jgi:hypothetical protein
VSSESYASYTLLSEHIIILSALNAWEGRRKESGNLVRILSRLSIFKKGKQTDVEGGWKKGVPLLADLQEIQSRPAAEKHQ